jgi:ferredoxin-NADP reductase
MELPDTKTIRLKWPDGYNPDFKTGQFITLYWPDTPNYKRAYSLSSCALDRGFYEVTVKRDGKMGTRIVDWAKAGDKFFVIPPVGKFLPVYESNKHLVCVAGGSGVTPFRGFVREATRRKLETKITVLYSVRTPIAHLLHGHLELSVALRFRALETSIRDRLHSRVCR